MLIGVVDDVRDAPGVDPPMRYYLPLDLVHPIFVPISPPTLVMRTRLDGGPALATAARSMLPSGQRATIEVIQGRVDRALRPWHTATLLFVGLGLMALTLACIGVYSIIADGALERRREMGVCARPLGATRQRSDGAHSSRGVES